MYRDFEELLPELNDSKVQYLVVGGYAVSFHAQPRATKGLDLLVKPIAENAAALYQALAKFGAPLADLKPDDFAQKGGIFRMGSPPFTVDILPEISGVDFNRAWRKRVAVTIDVETGLTAWFISGDDLIAARLAAGRPQGLADVEALRRATARDKRGAASRRRKIGRECPLMIHRFGQQRRLHRTRLTQTKPRQPQAQLPPSQRQQSHPRRR